MKISSRLILSTVFLMILTLASALAYFLGYRAGQKTTLRAEVHGKMWLNAGLHSSLARGNIKKMQSTLNMILLAATREYQGLFPSEAATNQSALYKCAQRTSDEIEKALVTLPMDADELNEKLKEKSSTNAP